MLYIRKSFDLNGKINHKLETFLITTLKQNTWLILIQTSIIIDAIVLNDSQITFGMMLGTSQKISKM